MPCHLGNICDYFTVAISKEKENSDMTKQSSKNLKKGVVTAVAVATVASQFLVGTPFQAKAAETNGSEATQKPTPRALAVWTNATLETAAVTPLNLDTQVGGNLRLDFWVNAWGAGLAEEVYMTTEIPVEFRPLIEAAYEKGTLFDALNQTGKITSLGIFGGSISFSKENLTYDKDSGVLSMKTDQALTIPAQSTVSYQMNLDYKSLYNDLKVAIPDSQTGNGYHVKVGENSSGYVSIQIGDRGAEAYTAEKQAIVGTGGLPTLTGVSDTLVQVNEEFDPLAGVKATDKEDGDLTNKIVVDSDVNINKPGVYTVTYTVTDSDRNETKVERKITVSDENIKGTVSPKAYQLGQENVTGSYTGDVKTVALVVNGEKYPQVDVRADGSFSYYAEDKITNATDDVRLVGYSAYGKVLDDKPVKIGNQQGTITPAEYTVGSSNITGTYTGDVEFAKLYVNGVLQSQGGTFANGGFSYYVNPNVIKAGDIVTIEGYTKDGQTSLTEKVPVKVNGAVTAGTITPNSYTVGNSTITGSYTGDVANARLTVNGKVVSWGGTFTNGSFSYYTGTGAIKAGDTVVLTAYDKDEKQLDQKTVTVNGGATQGAISPKTYAVNDSNITGSYTGDVAKARLTVNGKVVSWGGSFSGGSFSYYVGSGAIKAGDTVVLTAYDKNDKQLDQKTVTVSGSATTQGTISPNTFTVGDLEINGTYTGDVAKARISINGKAQAWGGTFSNGSFSYYVGADKIKAGDVVTISAYDKNDRLLDGNKTITVKSSTSQGTISPDSYSVGNVTITGAYTGDITMARVSINGVQQAWGGSFENGRFSYYVGANKIKAGDVVTISAYNELTTLLDQKSVAVIN